MSLLSKKKKKNNSIKGGEKLFRHKLKTSDPLMNNRFLNKLPPLKGKGREGKRKIDRPQILHDVSFKTSQTAVALTKSKRREFRRIPPLYYLTVFFFLLFFFYDEEEHLYPADGECFTGL